MPNKQPTTKDIISGVSGTNSLKALLKDTMVTTCIAGAEEAIEKVIQQLQRDISADKTLSAKEGWAIIKALHFVQDYILMFSKVGNTSLAEEKANAAKTST